MAKIDTTVGKLVDMIRDGDLRLPEMQRRYVWPARRSQMPGVLSL
jgi:hypothetical protein